MGFGSYNFGALTETQQIVARLLKGFPTAQIVEIGGDVIRVLENFKIQHLDKIPKKMGRGFLDMAFPINDFELAMHLLSSKNPAMTEINGRAKGLPILIAYLEILTNSTDLPDDLLLESALSFAIHVQTLEGGVAKLWNQELQTDVERLGPLAITGQKFITGRKPAKLGPVAKKIKAYLQKSPAAKASDVWLALKKSPPKGLVFMESERWGRYIEKGCETVMEWRRFQNLVSEHRPKN